ncbi:MAG TPA: hypothetical protein ENF42_01755 [Candidatus Bathyarchaeota archaeon]|nr:hypothetical protein [Candidatus Bathyarchaeota archaeon]
MKGLVDAVSTIIFVFVVLGVAVNYEVYTPTLRILEPLEVELKTPDSLHFDIGRICAGGRSGHDHVLNVFVKRTSYFTLLYLWYLFDSTLCSEAVYVDYYMSAPQDWSSYDGIRINIYGDQSNNTLQIWFFDSLTGRWWGIGCLTLNWKGWRQLEFYMPLTYKRRSVTQLRFIILHEFVSPVNVTFQTCISNLIFIENIKGKLNIQYRTLTPGDEVNVTMLNDGTMIISYRFSSSFSNGIIVDREFHVFCDWNQMRTLTLQLKGDDSGNIIQFWFLDGESERWVGIKSLVLDWGGWRTLKLSLPEYPRSKVKVFRIIVLNGKRIDPTVPARGCGTIILRNAILKDVARIPLHVKLLLTLAYTALLAFLYVLFKWPLHTPKAIPIILFLTSALTLATGREWLAEDLMAVSCIFFLVSLIFKRPVTLENRNGRLRNSFLSKH